MSVGFLRPFFFYYFSFRHFLFLRFEFIILQVLENTIKSVRTSILSLSQRRKCVSRSHCEYLPEPGTWTVAGTCTMWPSRRIILWTFGFTLYPFVHNLHTPHINLDFKILFSRCQFAQLRFNRSGLRRNCRFERRQFSEDQVMLISKWNAHAQPEKFSTTNQRIWRDGLKRTIDHFQSKYLQTEADKFVVLACEQLVVCFFVNLPQQFLPLLH